MKIFIHSAYDCILATKRDLSDHLSWLLEHEKNQQAWELIDEHPEVISSSPEKLLEIGPGTPDHAQASTYILEPSLPYTCCLVEDGNGTLKFQCQTVNRTLILLDRLLLKFWILIAQR